MMTVERSGLEVPLRPEEPPCSAVITAERDDYNGAALPASAAFSYSDSSTGTDWQPAGLATCRSEALLSRSLQALPADSGGWVVTLLAAAWYSHILNLIVLGLGMMLMLIVLIQRGKGGGLAGAFGGAGGSSPFGSRAADQFVRITLWLAGVWVLVIMIHVKVVKYDMGEQSKTSITTPTQ
jgi:preprotein translocase subunit SecG